MRPMSKRPMVAAGSVRPAREPEPEHVHGRAQVLHREPRPLPEHGGAPVRGDHQVGPHLERSRGRDGADPGHAARLLDQIGGLGPHLELEGRKYLRAADQEVEEVPLRHHRDELAAGRQVREVGDGDRKVPELGGQPRHLLMRQPQELLQDPELVHQLERGGVDGVAPEVAQEVRVLLQHQHGHSGPGQEQAQHHAGGAAARDAAADRPRGARHGAPMLQCRGPGGGNPERTPAI